MNAREIIKRGDRIRCTSTEELLTITKALAGMAVHVAVLHDDACTPGVCVCSPHYVLERLTAATLEDGQRQHAGWVRRSTS